MRLVMLVEHRLAGRIDPIVQAAQRLPDLASRRLTVDGILEALAPLPPLPPVTRLAAESANPAAAGMHPLSAIEHTPADKMIRIRDIWPRCANTRVL
jgi:hypothetical protein